MNAWLVGLGRLYAFFNALNDSPSIVAPVISTHALGSRQALLLTAAAQAAGTLVLGTAIATTIPTRIVRPESLSPQAVLAALVAALLWSALTWATGLPSSSSHPLVGGLVGAALASAGPNALLLPGFVRVVGALVVSLPRGLLIGYLGV
jgi:inorganic phosphate transporter, PiT family